MVDPDELRKGWATAEVSLRVEIHVQDAHELVCRGPDRSGKQLIRTERQAFDVAEALRENANAVVRAAVTHFAEQAELPQKVLAQLVAALTPLRESAVDVLLSHVVDVLDAGHALAQQLRVKVHT